MGLFASTSFLVVCAKAYLSTDDPVHAIMYGLAAAAVLGFIGYRIGYIWSHPKGNKKKKKKAKTTGGGTDSQEPAALDPALTPLTGDETFLDDVTSGG